MKSNINNNSISQSEETRLINPEPAVNTRNTVGKNSKQKSGKGSVIAAGAGGFVAGMAGGIGGTAVAATVDDAEIKADVENHVETESIDTPNKEDVILANDEGVRYAHVDADNFNDAFAQARAQVGPGGVFEYNGRLYGTYLADEWDAMTPQQRADYQNRVNEIAPSHAGATSGNATHPSKPLRNNDDDNKHKPDPSKPNNNDDPGKDKPNPSGPSDNEIRVIGVEAVEDEDGGIMNVALVEHAGEQAMLVDLDDDGMMDVLIHDYNQDGQIQANEVYDVSGQNLSVADLIQAQAAGEGDFLYASNDGMPDYVNDADSTMFV